MAGNQPPVLISHQSPPIQQWAIANDNFTRLNTQLQNLGYQPSTATLTRGAGVQSVSKDIDTGIRNAPAFIGFVSIPNSSPAFVEMLPNFGVIVSGGVSPDYVNGSITSLNRAIYDPTTGVIRCFIESTVTQPSYNIAETYTFIIYLIGAQST